jgi:hypothetical protein
MPAVVMVSHPKDMISRPYCWCQGHYGDSRRTQCFSVWCQNNCGDTHPPPGNLGRWVMLAPVAVRFRPVAVVAATAAAAIPLTAFLRGISLYTMHEIIKRYLGLLDLWEHLHICIHWSLDTFGSCFVRSWQRSGSLLVGTDRLGFLACLSTSALVASLKVGKSSYDYRWVVSISWVGMIS